MLCCPVCRSPLTSDGHSYRCQNNHCFDIAKSGYVHLLEAESMRSKMPGDNKLMVEARRKFLQGGHYEPLSDCVNQMAAAALCGIDRPALLDAGCGEGYYTARLADSLPNAEIIGLDISKAAIEKAARRSRRVTWAVASAFHAPLADGGCDLILNLFAPYCGGEYLRLLRPDGRFLMAIPAENHLWELKQAIYERPYKNSPKDFALAGFQLERRESVSRMLHLTSAEEIDCLFKMTPYYYKTGLADQQRLAGYDSLEVQMDFTVLLYRRG